MAKRKPTTKRKTGVTRTIKLMTWRDNGRDDVLVRVDTFAATEGGLAKLEGALARRIGRAFWSEV